MNSALVSNLIFTGAYGTVYVILAIVHLVAWGEAKHPHQHGNGLIVTSIILWVVSFLAEMTFFGIFSAIPLVAALICAAWGLSALRHPT